MSYQSKLAGMKGTSQNEEDHANIPASDTITSACTPKLSPLSHDPLQPLVKDMSSAKAAEHEALCNQPGLCNRTVTERGQEG